MSNSGAISQRQLTFAEQFEQAKSLGLTAQEMKKNLEDNIALARHMLRWHFGKRNCYGGEFQRRQVRLQIQALRQVNPFRDFLLSVPLGEREDL